MSKRLAVFAAVLLLFAALSACDNAVPEIAGTPTPTNSPTPRPEAFTASITATPLPADQLGREIVGDAHYYQYLSFGALRVYEYGTGTFLDGVCVNAYPLPLDGQLDIVYYNADGKLCGVGTIENDAGGTQLKPGSNRIYAEIHTDIDVRMKDFVLEIKKNFQPVEENG